MTKWFLDTEFDEDGKTIELISIALVSAPLRGMAEPGYCTYYAVSSEFSEEHCNDWVKQHVLPGLPSRDVRKPRELIAREIQGLVLGALPTVLWSPPSKPEFWGYFADYDWVVFCQLFGRMVDLPTGMPMYCNDIKQLMHMVGISKDELPQQDPATEHNALADALWNREAYYYTMRRALIERIDAGASW